MPDFFDYYAVLGIKPDASDAEIHTAYRMTAKRCHPDMGGSSQEMMSAIEAWQVLSSANRRRAYDEARAVQARANAITRWRDIAAEARREASQIAAVYAPSFEEFSHWLDQAAQEVQSRASGRFASGGVVGFLAGSILGAIAGGLLGPGMTAGGICGAVAGSVAGAVAARSRRPASSETSGH